MRCGDCRANLDGYDDIRNHTCRSWTVPRVRVSKWYEPPVFKAPTPDEALEYESVKRGIHVVIRCPKHPFPWFRFTRLIQYRVHMREHFKCVYCGRTYVVHQASPVRLLRRDVVEALRWQ